MVGHNDAAGADIDDSDTEIQKEEEKQNSYVDISGVGTDLEKSNMLVDFKDQKLSLKILMKIDLRNQD